MAEPRIESSQRSWPRRLRQPGLMVLFAMVLVIPKTLGEYCFWRRWWRWSGARTTATTWGASGDGWPRLSSTKELAPGSNLNPNN